MRRLLHAGELGGDQPVAVGHEWSPSVASPDPAPTGGGPGVVAAIWVGVFAPYVVLAAALPIGANVFLFSQRYRKEEEMVTAAVAVSTAVALLTISAVLALLPSLAS